jgi:hypothetical protein
MFIYICRHTVNEVNAYKGGYVLFFTCFMFEVTEQKLITFDIGYLCQKMSGDLNLVPTGPIKPLLFLKLI